MKNFISYNPTRLVFGHDTEGTIGTYVADAGIQKVLLLYGSERIKNNGLFDAVTHSLKEKNIEFVALGGVISSPVLSKIYEGIEVAREHKVDAILGVGGGSVADSAKIIAAGVVYDGDVWDLFNPKASFSTALPVFTVMTLAATGSEMNCGAAVTNEKTSEKFLIKDPCLYPKVSIINPDLQKTVTRDYLVYSASDVIAHSIEGYFTASYYPNITASYVETNIRTVIETTEVLLNDPNDYNARAEFAWAATQALNGSTMPGTAGISLPNHMIEMAIAGIHHVPHGAGLSIVMPSWMRWYCSQNRTQFERFAAKIFGKVSAEEGISALENWFNQIGTPTRLSQVNIKASDIDDIVEKALGNAPFFALEHIYTKDIIKEILTKAL
ncbi:iron-containing alcohol dehydrogenase [Celerinatantimonas sp. YJH-8]|uniref:iron-containing alcohol dehydrogenase n=1 Tax=Celerinatantimonas sp. YJH-8 TaxID=3228714 RepID=UPI0038C37548